MRDEVEEFLRRVAQMRAQAEAQARAAQQRPAQPPPQPQQPQRPPQQRMPLDPRPQQPPPRLAAPREEVLYLEPADVEVIDAELAEGTDRPGSKGYFGSAEKFDQRARKLGAEVDQADDRLDAHLHQVFDHQTGSIHQSTDQAAAAPSDAKRAGFTAGSIVDLLRSPDNIRNAIILGEILRRPDEQRWLT